MDDALDVIGGLITEDGRPWSDAAVDVQIEDMSAWLHDDRPYHYATRSRGFSKSADAAALALGALLTDPLMRGFWLASDQEQGRLAIESITGYVQRTPGLAGALVITANKVTSVHGGSLEILAADAAGAWGRRPSWLIVDEIANWAETSSSLRLWQAMSTALTKVAGARAVLITSAGNPRHFAYRVLEHARRSELWRTSETPGPAPWADPARLADQRASLPPAVYDQLYGNVWTEPEGDFLDPGVVDAAFVRPGPSLRAALNSCSYIAGLDLGAVHDRTVLAIGHREGDRTALDLMRVWTGRRGHPVDFDAVGAEVLELYREFRFSLSVDPWQAYELISKLEKQDVDVRPFHFSPQSKTRLASTLLHSINTGTVELYPAEGLRDELVALRVKPSTSGSGMFAFDHAPGEHDDRATSLALMLVEALEHGEPGTVETIFYAPDPTLSTVIRRDDMFLTGERFLDETGELDAYGEPIRRPPARWTVVDPNPNLKGAS